jgi:hypothetical protein
MSCFHKNKKINPKFHMETQRPQIAKAILSKKSNAGGITISQYLNSNYTAEP